jgi:hypothetical protein
MQTFVCLYHHSCCIRKLKYQTARTIIKIPDSTTVHPDGEGYTSESFSARLVLSTCQESTIDTDGYWSLSPTGSDHLVVAPSLRVLPKSVAGHWKWRGHMSRWWRLMPPTQRISSNSGYHGWFFFIRILGVWNVSWSILFYSYILQIHFRTHIFEMLWNEQSWSRNFPLMPVFTTHLAGQLSGGGALLGRSRHRFLVRIGRIIAAFCIPSELVQFAQKYSEFISHHNPILLVTVHFLYHSLSFLQARHRWPSFYVLQGSLVWWA